MSAIDQHARGLALTGERTGPGIWHESYWYARHLAAYRFVASAIARRAVATAFARADAAAPITLDAGCGEGYGIEVLRDCGSPVVGLDYDPDVTRHAGRGTDRNVLRGNVVRLPLAAGCVDAVVSLQVVEHIWTPLELVDEFHRVLRPGGLLALSTPNRLSFSPGLQRGARPTNPFHVREYDGEELLELVGTRFAETELLGVHRGPRLVELDERYGSLTAAQLAAPPELWDGALAAAVRSVRPEDFVVGRAADDALDLLVLASRA
ncbi:class I SAM-dependent methyltransferase [Angustibacter sp. McL0619]|uniref:class I SAM-dependent methyltransferase n=1 Tax=Angustibacter sp. McL0619 TaxID=3415676 RepID=UPI003CF12DC5